MGGFLNFEPPGGVNKLDALGGAGIYHVLRGVNPPFLVKEGR